MKLVHKPFPDPGFWRSFATGLILTVALAGPASAAPPDNPACARDHCIDGRTVNIHADGAARHAVTEPSPGEHRFELRADDRWSQDRGAPRERAELSFDEEPVRFDTLYRVSYEMLIEGNAPIASDWLVVGQWHATEDPGDASSSPVLGLALKGRDLTVFTQSTEAAHHAKNPQAVQRARIKNIARGRWIAIAYDVRFNPRLGSLDLRIDGRKVFSGAIPIGYADAVGPYFKFGIYRSPTRQTLVVRYRNLTIREAAP
jgi:hypothetical protein